jgi:hypothetical protein
MKTLMKVVLLVIGIGWQGFAACNPDASTSRAVDIPSGLQSAISTLNLKLSGPFTLAGQGVTVTGSVTPSISVIEQDCKDADGCICGIYDTGTGSLSGDISLSANLGSKSFGPFSVSAWGYTVSVNAGASISANGNGNTSSGLSISRDCSGDWHYSASGNLSEAIAITGNGTGTGTLTSNSSTNSISATCTVGATATFNVSYSLSESDISVSGSFAGSGTGNSFPLDITIDISGYGPLTFQGAL